MFDPVGRIPVRTIVYIVVSWILLAVVNIVFIKAGFYENVPQWFPISVFNGPTIRLSGFPYLLLFLVVVTCGIRFAPKMSIYQVWLIGLSLIILGNLGQGDWNSGFQKPFYMGHIQYYHDAIKISSWSGWLESFNASQHTLLVHTKSHPPFAVLIHYLLMEISGNSLAFLSMTFVLMSSLSIVLVWHMFKALGVPLERRNLLAVLFSVIPAVNIYGAVSLDGVILTSATLFLFGLLLLLLQKDRISKRGLLLMLLGLTITNLLTYGGVFLFAVAGIQAIKEIVVVRRFRVAIAFVISIGVFMAITVTMVSMSGYDHIQGFLTACALENPDGFRGLHKPVEYLATRVECISEIALFLSLGFLAMLFHSNKLGFSWSDWRRIDVGIMLSGIMTLVVMLVSGAFRTGETARAALFVYPYIMLTLTNANSRIVKDIVVFAGLQTFGMQLLGGYFW